VTRSRSTNAASAVSHEHAALPHRRDGRRRGELERREHERIGRERPGDHLHEPYRRMARLGVAVGEVDRVRVAAALEVDPAKVPGEAARRLPQHHQHLQRHRRPPTGTTGATATTERRCRELRSAIGGARVERCAHCGPGRHRNDDRPATGVAVQRLAPRHDRAMTASGADVAGGQHVLALGRQDQVRVGRRATIADDRTTSGMLPSDRHA